MSPSLRHALVFQNPTQSNVTVRCGTSTSRVHTPIPPNSILCAIGSRRSRSTMNHDNHEPADSVKPSASQFCWEQFRPPPLPTNPDADVGPETPLCYCHCEHETGEKQCTKMCELPQYENRWWATSCHKKNSRQANSLRRIRIPGRARRIARKRRSRRFCQLHRDLSIPLFMPNIARSLHDAGILTASPELCIDCDPILDSVRGRYSRRICARMLFPAACRGRRG